MKIQLIGSCLLTKEALEIGMPTRFNIISVDGEMIGQIYEEDKYHITHFWRADDYYYHQKVEYVGGGYLTECGGWFDSASCKQEFGFDRPKDVQAQKKILDELKRYIDNLE